MPGVVQNKKAALTAASLKRMMGLEPTTFCMASRRSSQLSYIRVAASIALGLAAENAGLDKCGGW